MQTLFEGSNFNWFQHGDRQAIIASEIVTFLGGLEANTARYIKAAVSESNRFQTNPNKTGKGAKWCLYLQGVFELLIFSDLARKANQEKIASFHSWLINDVLATAPQSTGSLVVAIGSNGGETAEAKKLQNNQAEDLKSDFLIEQLRAENERLKASLEQARDERDHAQSELMDVKAALREVEFSQALGDTAPATPGNEDSDLIQALQEQLKEAQERLEAVEDRELDGIKKQRKILSEAKAKYTDLVTGLEKDPNKILEFLKPQLLNLESREVLKNELLPLLINDLESTDQAALESAETLQT